MKRVLAFVFVAAFVGSPAIGQTQPQPQPQQQVTAKTANPNDVICEKEDETGSRLSSHKVCHTRAQWEQMRLSDRQATEHVQAGVLAPISH